MPKLAMVPETQAVKGLTFKALVDARCFKCNLHAVCSKVLKPGWRYVITSVRKASHTCPIIGERMLVVEVEEAPVRAVVKTKVAVAGVKTRYERVECSKKGCSFRSVCAQAPLLDGELVRIVNVLNNIACPRGLQLTLAELLPAE